MTSSGKIQKVPELKPAEWAFMGQQAQSVKSPFLAGAPHGTEGDILGGNTDMEGPESNSDLELELWWKAT